jgi:hypothetical protein
VNFAFFETNLRSNYPHANAVRLLKSSHGQLQLPAFFSWIVSFLLFFVRVELFLCSFLPKDFSFCFFSKVKENLEALHYKRPSKIENKTDTEAKISQKRIELKTPSVLVDCRFLQICTINFSFFVFFFGQKPKCMCDYVSLSFSFIWFYGLSWLFFFVSLLLFRFNSFIFFFGAYSEFIIAISIAKYQKNHLSYLQHNESVVRDD